MQFDRPLATITPTIDGDILMVMAAADGPFTTGQIRRTLNRYSDEGIRKVLARLAAQGVVLADRVGNIFAYRLNDHHLAAGAIRELARLASTFTTSLEHHLQGWDQPPIYAAVFGAAARGEMTVDDDIDLCLIRGHDATDAAWRHQVDDLASTVTRWTGNATQITEYRVAEVRQAATTPVLRDVLVRGLTVAGSREWLIDHLRADVRGPRVQEADV